MDAEAFGPNLAYVLALLANAGQITSSQIKKARLGLPFLSHAKWSELAPSFGLPADLMMAQSRQFDPFSIAPIRLPPSFHESTAEGACQDVYQERLSQEREEAGVRVFDAVCAAVEDVLMFKH